MSVLRERIHQLEQVYAELEHSLRAFKAAGLFGCKTGCGACCTKPNAVWATVGELLPMAWKIYQEGRLEAVCQQLAQHLSSSTVCPVYKASGAAEGMGQCGSYKERPMVCRLFGSAVQHTRDGDLAVLACGWQRAEFAAAIFNIETSSPDHSHETQALPVASDWSWRVQALMLEDSLRAEYPIHQALYEALLLVDQAIAYEPALPEGLLPKVILPGIVLDR